MGYYRRAFDAWRRKLEKYAAAGVTLLFFLALAGLGPGVYPDTPGYLSMDIARDPMYPLFLRFCMLAGEKAGLYAAVFLQNALCAAGVYLFYGYVKRKAVVEAGFTGASRGFLSLGIFAALLAPHIVTPLLSSSGMILTNAILSEGLCYPVYQLYLYFLLHVLFGERAGVMGAAALFCSLLLVLLRGQMLPSALVWAVVVLYRLLMDKRFKRLWPVLLCVPLVFGMKSVLTGLYNLQIHGVYTGGTSGNLTALTNLLYASEREDGEALGDKELEELFARMYDEMEEKRYTYRFAGSSMTDRAVHHEFAHDLIKFEIVTPVLQEYVQGEARDKQEKDILVNELAGRFTGALVLKSIGNRLEVYTAAAWCGMIRTAAFLRPGVNAVTVFCYLLLTALCLKELAGGRENSGALLWAFAMLAVCANVFATSLMIMCLSRYVIYNTPLLYTAGLLLAAGELRRLEARGSGKKTDARKARK